MTRQLLGLLLLLSTPGAAIAQAWLLESTSQGDIPIPNSGNEQTACVVGDIDGDGRQDIVVAERTEAPAVTMFSRHTDGWERTVIDNGILPIEAGGAIVDIDGDGYLDICFSGDYQSNQIWWWQNPGPPPYPVGGWTRRLIKNSGANTHHDLAFGDFTGNGVMDLAFWNQSAGGILYLAQVPADPRSSGPWAYVPIFDGASDSEGLATSDINGDGKIDLVGAGYWFEHTGGTNFTAHVVASGRSYTRTAAGQLVAGGRPEIVIGPGDDTGPLIWYEWNGSTWQPNTLDASVVNGHSLRLGDVNGNGLLDIFVAEMHTPGAGADARSRFFYNQGGGAFTSTTISVGVGNHESCLADVDGDGRLDLAGKPYSVGAPGLNVWLQRVAGEGTAFDPAADCLLDANSGAAVAGVAVADFDADGYPDMIAWLQGGGVRAFRGPNWAASDLNNTELSAAAWADLDHDGDLDLVAATAGTTADVVWLSNPGTDGGLWPLQFLYAVNDTVSNLLVTDLENDGVVDVIVFAGTRIVNLSSVDGTTWTPAVIANVAPGTATGWLADIDRDGDLDLGRGGLWWRNLRGSWQQNDMPGSLSSDACAWSTDIDRDGWPDIFAVDPQSCGTLQSMAADKFGGLVTVSVRNDLGLGELGGLAALDVDRDGDLDLVLAGLDCAGAPTTLLLRSTGSGIDSWTIEPVASASRLAAADLDRDGATDLALGAPVGDCRLAFGRNLDTFRLPLGNWARHVIDAARPWGALFVLHGDLDRDGREDIISGGWWYRNPGVNEDAWTRQTIGDPLNNVILVHDLDRDGDLDLFGTEGQGGAANPNLYWAENDGQGGFIVHPRVAVGHGDFPQGVAIGRFGQTLQDGVIPESIALSWHDQDNGIELLTVPANPGTTPWTLTTLSPFTLNEELQVADLDRDGDLDLSLGTAWQRNNGTSWTPFTVATSAQAPDRHRLADLDRDGRLDLVVGVEAIGLPGPVTWYRQPTDPTQPWAGTVVADVIGPMSLDAADLDLDGDLDLAVGEHLDTTGARLLVLENAGNSTWDQQLVYQGDEHHDGAQFVDIDNDGDLDIISIGWFHDRVVLYENLAINGTGQPVDSTPPFLLWVRSTAAETGSIVARFSEPVDPLTANDPGNYQLSPAAVVTEATLMADGFTVRLQANTMVAGTTYELRTTDVQDLAAYANSSLGSLAVTFVRAPWPRVETGIVSLWDFGSGPAATVYDVAPAGDPLDLVIADPTAVIRGANALTLSAPVRVATTGAATKITEACQQSDEITIEAWVRPALALQTGPARIATLSTNRNLRNATLAQGLATTDGDRYSARLRTTTTDLNGLPTVSTTGQAINQDLQHLVLIRDANQVIRIYVDGQLQFTETRAGDFSNWDSSHGFAVGGEFTYDATVCWLGELSLVAVYDHALTAAEVLQNLAAGPESQVVAAAVEPELAPALLGAMFPNPFNARISLEVQLARTMPLTLTVYDVRGRQVRRLSAGEVFAGGTHVITWDGNNDGGQPCASGSYFVQVSTAEAVEIRKIMLVK
ncbi:MAG: FG-GAP-like repeat-containing protein [Candidatus Krumholzibacteria bacterium]|nr:FG-GAP-like repeat-containing protein [Candidatus Krumholzibacteria bacterium]